MCGLNNDPIVLTYNGALVTSDDNLNHIPLLPMSRKGATIVAGSEDSKVDLVLVHLRTLSSR